MKDELKKIFESYCENIRAIYAPLKVIQEPINLQMITSIEQQMDISFPDERNGIF